MDELIIVEDERIIRESLASFNWDTIQVKVVASFDNGLSALEYIRENTVDIALVDMRMPVMDGVEFVKCLHVEFPEISVIGLSGYSDYTYLRECMKYGVKDYLLKPTDKNELFETVATILKEKNMSELANMDSNPDQSCSYAISKALEYIENNYKSVIKLSDVAESVHLHPTYFSRIFKQQMGVRFVDYLRDFRIKKSIELMKDPKMNISTIAMETGFFSARYFAEIFKKKKGMSPSEYRNKKNLE